MNVSDYLLKRLRAWGVRTVFGYPGDGINGVMGALNRDDHGLRFVQARHEEMAARYAASQDIPGFPYARYADLIGLQGIEVDKPEQIREAWQSALSASRPVVIQARVDPDVAPFPPHITLKQAKSFGLSLLKMDSEEEGIIKQAIHQLFPEASSKSES